MRPNFLTQNQYESLQLLGWEAGDGIDSGRSIHFTRIMEQNISAFSGVCFDCWASGEQLFLQFCEFTNDSENWEPYHEKTYPAAPISLAKLVKVAVPYLALDDGANGLDLPEIYNYFLNDPENQKIATVDEFSLITT